VILIRDSCLHKNYKHMQMLSTITVRLLIFVGGLLTEQYDPFADLVVNKGCFIMGIKEYTRLSFSL